jgi:FkbM family methyltransferase
MPKLLNIAIPTYNRWQQLIFALDHFIDQIENRYETLIDIFISDDCSTDHTEYLIGRYAKNHSFIHYRKYDQNIGLERNLIECTNWCDGKYLWIFGDDDFLENNQSLSYIIELLKIGAYEFIILNRSRKSFDLSKKITNNWMRVDTKANTEYPSLKDFCKQWGIISIIGFISVNIFLRDKFAKVNSEKYFGIMYPQLGTMLEAFYDQKCLLVTKPMVCHRTQTLEEKRAALGNKESEKDFMSDYDQRDAIYFSFKLIGFLNELIWCGAFAHQDLNWIREFVFANMPLTQFIIRNMALYEKAKLTCNRKELSASKKFFDNLLLSGDQEKNLKSILARMRKQIKMDNKKLMISVVTPSFNQAEFLSDCLDSVKIQTYKPIEHLVFDPGSQDDSRDIAREYDHVQLIAEKDSGQSDALNKGFERSMGDIIAWINSDDYYHDETVFQTVIDRFQQPDQPDIVYGKGIYVDEENKKLRNVYINKKPETLSWRLQQEDGILQPALFMRKDVIDVVGPLSEHRHFCMDYEFWIRCIQNNIKFAYIDKVLAVARYHIKNKTYGLRDKSYHEVMEMLLEHFGYANHVWLRRCSEYISEGLDGVLQHSGNCQLSQPESVEQNYRDLLKAYNTNHDTYQLLQKNIQLKGYRDTAHEMKKLAIEQSTPCIEIPLEQGGAKNRVCYTVGERRWAFDTRWKNRQIEKTHRFLDSEIANRKKNVCIIVGNGPSLKEIDFSLFEGQDVIVSNNAFLDNDLIKYAKYYTVVNYLVAEQGFYDINLLKDVTKILPYWLSYCVNSDENTFFIDAIGYPEFSTNIYKNVSWRHTVSFYNMHIAYGLGYRKVLLVGFDHYFKQSDTVKEGEIIHNYDDDVNHFSAEYFKGKKWQAAGVDKMEEMYILAKEAFEKDHREIINCTVGGKLELFRRGDLSAELEAVGEEDDIRKIIRSVSEKDSATEHILYGTFERHHGISIDESDLVHQLLKQINAGKIMIDVGAHHGHAMMPYAKEGWTIHAFEPDPDNRKVLTERISGYGDIYVNEVAVSDRNHTGQCFYQSKESSGISSLLRFNSSHEEICKVDTISLASYIERNDINEVTLLKIDTEGNDYNVLNGFPWEKLKPTMIIAEFEDRKSIELGYDFHDMAKYLRTKGYELYVSEWHPIVRYGIEHDWCRMVKYPSELISKYSWGNIIAIDKKIMGFALDEHIKAYLQRKIKKRDSLKLSKKSVNEKIKQKLKRLTMRTQNKYRTNYIKIADYLIHNYPGIAFTARFLIRSIRLTSTIYPKTTKLFLLVVVLGVIGALIMSSHRWLMSGLSLGLIISGSMFTMLRYAVAKLLKQKRFYDRKLERIYNQELAGVKYKIAHSMKNLKSLVNEQTEINANIDMIKTDLVSIEEKILNNLADVEKELIAQLKHMQNQIAYYTKGTHQFFNRYVSQDFLSRLQKKLNGHSDFVNINQNTVNYLGNYIYHIENKCKGRFAGDIEDVILRNIFIQSINKDSLKLLEIGTLFGIQLAIYYNTCRGYFDKIEMVAIDPLDGYYGADNSDLLTNEPINEAIFEHNMRIADVAEKDIFLIKELSNSKSALSEAKKNKYDVLVIDGDHSYGGVKYDFENYCDMVSKQGIIIFDDYMSEEWPGVTKYIDEEVKFSDMVEFVYADYRTVIFRKV